MNYFKFWLGFAGQIRSAVQRRLSLRERAFFRGAKDDLALVVLVAGLLSSAAWADEPGATYIFPAGGQRGTTVVFRVGGLYLHEGAMLQMLGPGVAASPRLAPVETIWFEGPIVPLPGSQQKEDYPKDYGGQVAIASDAPLGLRYWRVATSQGATPSLKFLLGDLPGV